MKKIAYYITSVLCLCLYLGCSDFLEESSQDLMIPKTVKDYKEFLYGEGIDNNTVIHDYLDIMTDDTEEWMSRGFLANDWRLPVWGYYTWQEDPEIGINNEMTADNAWDTYYHRILVTNVILNDVENIEGDKNEKYDLMAECYFIRAYSYFMLANLYGKPYIDAENAAKDPCVPINNEVSISDKMFGRATVADVYKHIESDLTQAVRYFRESNLEKSIFRPNLPTAYLLLSRVSLFQKKYQETINYADSVMKTTRAVLCDLNTYTKSDYFFSSLNPELLYSYGWSSISAFQESASYLGVLIPSKELMALYSEDDLRLTYYYAGSKKTKPLKWDKYSNVYAHAFRISEVFLNRAEAYAELENVQSAISEINALREKRFSKESPIQAASKEEIIQKVREERRMELCFEGFRWFDLRRWDRPRIEHTYSSADDVNAYDIYVLEENSPSYTLPIPKKERDLNTVIERFERQKSITK